MFYLYTKKEVHFMYNYNYPNNNQAQMMGQMYGNRMPQNIPFTQPLKEDQVKELQKNDKFFSLKVTQDDINRAICTHKYPNTNTFSVDVLPDGEMVCKICGARMNPDALTPEKVEKIVADYENLLQSCKLMYVNIPENVARQFFSMIPFVHKTPQLYKIATENYQRFAPNANVTQDVYNANGTLNEFRQIVGGGFMNPGMGYGAPIYGQGYAYTPQYNQQYQGGMPYGAAMNTPYQQPQYPNNGFPYGYQDPNANPFYANGTTPNPMMGQPVTPPTQPMGQPVQPPTQPKAPTAPQGNTAVERVNATATLDA